MSAVWGASKAGDREAFDLAPMTSTTHQQASLSAIDNARE